MELLWKSAPRTITQMTKVLGDAYGWDKSTVITLLKRLLNKNAVYFEQGTKAKMFYPAVRQEETRSNEAKTFLEKTFSGNIGLMVSTMIHEEALSEQDIKELEQILKQHGGEDSSKQ